MKRIFLIIGFLAFVVLAGIAIYYVFFNAPDTPGPNTNTGNVNGGGLPSTNVDVNRPDVITNSVIPTINGTPITNGGAQNVNASAIANGGVTQVRTVTQPEDAILNAQLNPNADSLVYYNDADDKFYQVSADGTGRKELSGQEFPDVESVTWADNNNRAVISFPDNSKVVYDFQDKRQYSLPKEAEGFSFSPDSNQVAYKYLPSDVEDRFIVTQNIDGSGTKFVEALGDEAANVEVDWSPKGDIVATFRKSVDSSRQEVFFIGQNKENFKSAIVEGRGFTGDWSPNGDHLLYSVYSAESNYNPTLSIVNASGDLIGSGRTDLGLNTWPEKCTFTQSSTVLYCAEPSFLSPGSGLRPDEVTTANDRFFMINIATGDTQMIAEPDLGVNAKDLYLSSDGKTLYFTNTRTGRVESIRLP